MRGDGVVFVAAYRDETGFDRERELDFEAVGVGVLDAVLCGEQVSAARAAHHHFERVLIEGGRDAVHDGEGGAAPEIEEGGF